MHKTLWSNSKKHSNRMHLKHMKASLILYFYLCRAWMINSNDFWMHLRNKFCEIKYKRRDKYNYTIFIAFQFLCKTILVWFLSAYKKRENWGGDRNGVVLTCLRWNCSFLFHLNVYHLFMSVFIFNHIHATIWIRFGQVRHIAIAWWWSVFATSNCI